MLAIGQLPCVLKLFFVSFCLMPGIALATTPCYSLDPATLNLKPVFPALKDQGNYCLTSSVEQQSIQVYRTGVRPSSIDLPFFSFATSKATLDLGGYDVQSTEVERPGVRVLAPYKKIVGHSLSEIPDKNFVFHSLRVTNGRLILPGQGYDAIEIPRRILMASLESDLIDRVKPRKYPVTDATGSAFTAEVKEVFEQQGLKHWGNSVDNLEIIAGRTAVTMSGINNAVRDSKIIVTDSMAGTYMFGPGTVIENNIFIFRGIARTESAAPIKLHFGDKAVIRNNIFIIEEAQLAPEQAISLIHSKGVTITGNRVFGDAALVRKYDEYTSTIERDNIVMPLSEQPLVGEKMRAADQVDINRLARDQPGR